MLCILRLLLRCQNASYLVVKTYRSGQIIASSSNQPLATAHGQCLGDVVVGDVVHDFSCFRLIACHACKQEFFYRAAWNATRSYDEISVRPSVCPSVCQTRAL